MGMSASAHIFFGFVIKEIDEEEVYEGEYYNWAEEEDGDIYDWEEVYAKRCLGKPELPPYPDTRGEWDKDRGYREKYDPDTRTYSYDPPLTEQEEADMKANNDWWDKKRKLIDECGVEIRTSGYVDYPSATYVCLTKPHQQYISYEPEEIDMDNLIENPLPEDIEKIKSFCEVMGITYREPKWMVSADYG